MLSLRRFLGAASLALSLSASLIVMAAPHASAERVRIDDATADSQLSETLGEEEFNDQVDPGETQTDIQSVTFTYERGFLVSRVVVARVEGQGKQLYPYTTIRAGKLYRASRVPGGRVKVEKLGRYGEGQPLNIISAGICDGGVVRVNVATRTVTTKIPATCFRNPGQARVGLHLDRYFGREKRYFTYTDNAQSSGYEADADKTVLVPVVRG